jgi:HsdM N-terminal domain
VNPPTHTVQCPGSGLVQYPQSAATANLLRTDAVVCEDKCVATSSEGTRTGTWPLARRGQELTQQELESRLWAAANSLRGPVDPADFKSYVFPLLFFKWASDTWDLEHAAAVTGFGSDLTAEIEADFHRFAMPRGCHWSDLI